MDIDQETSIRGTGMPTPLEELTRNLGIKIADLKSDQMTRPNNCAGLQGRLGKSPVQPDKGDSRVPESGLYSACNPLLEEPAFVLPEIACVSDIIESENESPIPINRYSYKVFLVSSMSPFRLFFDSRLKAEGHRESLVKKLLNFWGAGATKLSCGHRSWLVVISAIRDVSDVTQADEKCQFSIHIKNLEQPIEISSPSHEEISTAQARLNSYLEMIRVKGKRIEANVMV